MNKFELKKFSSADELAQTAARDWLKVVAASRGKYTAAFSGGRIAKSFFAAVTDEVKRTGTSMSEVHFFWADERCVPPDNAESNFLVANELMLRPLAIAFKNIHRLQGELDPALAVADANGDIDQVASKNAAGMPVLDMIFLGLGEDGHTASLFPNASEKVMACQTPYLFVDHSPKPPPKRLSLSYAAIAAGKEVWALISGGDKDKPLRESLQPGGRTPFGRVVQSRSNTRIYTDLKADE